MHADLDALLTALYVLIDDFLPGRRGPGRPPQISDAELIFGLLLEKGSKLTPCVNKALGKLESSGELKQITDKWMGEAAGAPELR